MERIGTVLKFKPEVSAAEAAMALNQIRHVLDLPEEMAQPCPEVRAAIEAGDTVRFKSADWEVVPFKITSLIEAYDDDWGSPVWYIP